MSQTETILLVVLGFSLATLIALFIGRFVWALGLRLGARRMQSQVPSTLVGLQAERDRLRAEYAMLSQRLGSRLEQIKLQMAEHMAEVSRHRNRVEILRAEAADRSEKLTAADAEIVGLKSRITALELERAVATTELFSLRTAMESRDAELAALRLGQADANNGAPAPALAVISLPGAGTSQDRLKRRIEELTSLSRAIAGSKDQVLAGAVAETDPLVIAKLTEAARQTADLQEELERLDAEWSRRLNEISLSGGEAGDGKPGGVANVISLANRIRALRKDIAK